MRFFSSLQIAVLFGAFVSLFFLHGPAGMPILNVDDFVPDLSIPNISMPNVDALPVRNAGTQANPDQATQSALNSSVSQYYRWQDEQGIWHFSDRFPAGVTAELEQTREVNVIRFPPAVASETRDSSVPPIPDPDPNAVSSRLDTARETLQQAGQVQQQLESAMQAREQLLKNL